MKTKPQPLDLEEIKIIISDIGKKKAEQLVNYFKYKIKSACEFYMRYKDKPELLWDNHFIKNKEQRLKLFVFCDKLRGLREQEDIEDIEGLINEYNDWLFKLAFKDVLRENEN